MEDLLVSLVWLGFFAAVFLGWYFYLKARNKERMAMIEQGKDVSEIYSKREIRIRIPWLKIGLLITGIGLGLAVAIFLYSIPVIRNTVSTINEVFPVALMFLFGGFGIILGHYLDKPTK